MSMYQPGGAMEDVVFHEDIISKEFCNTSGADFIEDAESRPSASFALLGSYFLFLQKIND